MNEMICDIYKWLVYKFSEEMNMIFMNIHVGIRDGIINEWVQKIKGEEKNNHYIAE